MQEAQRVEEEATATKRMKERFEAIMATHEKERLARFKEHQDEMQELRKELEDILRDDEEEPVAAAEGLDEAGSVNKGSSLVQSASKASDHFQPDEYEQEKIPEDEMRQLTTGLRAGISSPSVDDDEFFGGVSQDVASLGEIRAHKALEDKRGRNG